MVDIAHPAMQPLYDPIRSMVYAAGERAVRHVFVGGKQVVRDGKALAFDYADASARLEMAQRDRESTSPRLGRAQYHRDHAADLSFRVSFSRFCGDPARDCTLALRTSAGRDLWWSECC
jgi:5-methylthioadenosine/S-adenosylhomocysteine deaminase